MADSAGEEALPCRFRTLAELREDFRRRQEERAAAVPPAVAPAASPRLDAGSTQEAGPAAPRVKTLQELRDAIRRQHEQRAVQDSPSQVANRANQVDQPTDEDLDEPARRQRRRQRRRERPMAAGHDRLDGAYEAVDIYQDKTSQFETGSCAQWECGSTDSTATPQSYTEKADSNEVLAKSLASEDSAFGTSQRRRGAGVPRGSGLLEAHSGRGGAAF